MGLPLCAQSPEQPEILDATGNVFPATSTTRKGVNNVAERRQKGPKLAATRSCVATQEVQIKLLAYLESNDLAVHRAKQTATR
jgi:hypothetical protein